MPKYNVHGRVLPEGVRITIEGLPISEWVDKEGRTTNYLVNIIDSHIGVEIEVDDGSQTISELTNQALELARAAVDGFCFSKGWGLRVSLDRFFDEYGIETVLLPVLEDFDVDISLHTVNSIHVVDPGALNDLYLFMTADPNIALAFNDLIAAITYPRFAEINCARAIDGIRVVMTPDGMSKTQGWEMMRDALNITEEALQTISKLSRGPRHGDRKSRSFHEVDTVIKRTWEIMRRFVEFARSGSKLSLSKYPRLLL
jgi:hypothetical protein